MNRDDRLGLFFLNMRKRDNLHTVRNLDIGQIKHLVQFELRNIDVQIFGQVFGQTGHLDVGHHLRDGTATLFDTDGYVFADIVNRHVHLDLLVLDNTLQIQMQDLPFGGMTLHVLENRCLAFLADLDIENARIERLVLELTNDLAVVECESARRPAGTIDDCRNFTFKTQAAARTFPLVFPIVRNQIEFLTHGSSPITDCL